MSTTAYDVLVIGGGHAGAEAAWAAARLGARTALVTISLDAIGRLSCNPAIGGIGKGQIVREIDALGGLMGQVTDEAGIQFRMLNRRKGPAVWAPRAQTDSELYPVVLRRYLEYCRNLDLLESSAEEITTESAGKGRHRVTGVVLKDGRRLSVSAVIVAAGTFLRGLMHTGEQQTPGGRIHEAAAVGLSASLEKAGLTLARLKTGTPPRVARESIDFSKLTEQAGDVDPVPFSFLTESLKQSQICCWLSSTNEAVHDLIRANLQRAPLYSGQIQSRGPRYCPSIEDKVVRFSDKQSHQVFLEPETRDSGRVYVNGISTSLPEDIQRKMVAMIEGLEHARVLQWGYAIEYDFVPPEQITADLMTKPVTGLFLAGQINGTSGYEEAAGQGLLAGVNAARYVGGNTGVTIARDEGYIGVMIDDLVTRGVTEPYRMFTSRAEYRLHLRYDNADARLTPLGRDWGLVNDHRWERFREKRSWLAKLMNLLNTLRCGGQPLSQLLRRPEEDGQRFLSAYKELTPFRAETDIWARALVEIKYAGYLQRQQRTIEEFQQLEARDLPANLDYFSIPHLRREAAERWAAVEPRSVGQAARVSGIHPTDISVLLIELAAQERRSSKARS
ncbi:MAG: tRNA uridine-5-carboxymethylaminomethyl(34) synthesis enzyme MnmG [Planctomycetota bacterium]